MWSDGQSQRHTAQWERASDGAVRSRSVPLQSQGPAAARPQGRRVRSSFGSSMGSYVLSPLLIHLHRCPSESRPWSWSPITAVRTAVVSVLLYIWSPVFGILWTGILWPALVECGQPWGPVRTQGTPANTLAFRRARGPFSVLTVERLFFAQ